MSDLTLPPKPPKPPPKLVKPTSAAPKAPATGSHTPKKFSVKPWTDAGQGKKILIYAATGMGKTTLASMAPSPVFIGLDDGGRLIRNPKTGEAINAINGVETFYDIRDAVVQPDLVPEGGTLVIDTVTLAEQLAAGYTLATILTKGDNGGKVAEHLEDYGWNKGYTFLTETFRLLLSDLDTPIRRGINVVLLAQQGQVTVANLAGTDYLQDGPKLYTAKNGTGIRSEVCEWCDHVLRIGYPDIAVIKANPKATKGKVHGTTQRAIFTTPELHYIAKSRPVNGQHLPPVISFETEQDDALWQFLFPGS